MKTATFEYTDKQSVDSSLANAVYYNSDSYTLAIDFKSNGYSTPVAIYGGISKNVYDSLVNAESFGKEYNSNIKNKMVNLSGGTIFNVTYEYVGHTVEDNEDATQLYMVRGYVRYQSTHSARNLEEARESFLDSLVGEGYDEDSLAVTEVYIVE